MNLQGANILLTGGSLGIGKATAALLNQKGAQVIITGRNKERLEAAARETGAIPVVADVTRDEDIDYAFDQVKKAFGNLDVLINNAGTGFRKELTELSREDFDKIFQVNVYGAAMMTRKAAEWFKSQEYGHIINIGSTAATKGYPTGSVYCASKFALRGMSQSWQAELRPYNVRVILINPSEVTTAFGNEERLEREKLDHKLRPEEIAHSIVSSLEMDNRGFIPELTVFATNPWKET